MDDEEMARMAIMWETDKNWVMKQAYSLGLQRAYRLAMDEFESESGTEMEQGRLAAFEIACQICHEVDGIWSGTTK